MVSMLLQLWRRNGMARLGAARCPASTGSGVLAGMVAACVLLTSCNTVRGIREDLPTVGSSTPAPEPVKFTGEPEIRVRLLRNTASKEVTAPARVLLRPVGGETSVRGVVMTAPIRFTSSAAGIRAVGAGKVEKEFPAGTDLEVLASDGRTDGVLTTPRDALLMDGQRIPGFVRIRPNWSDNPMRFDVIATMPLETYLPGVLMGEIPKDWPRQSYEAQAVAARTYALHERARARKDNRTADVENTTDDQVYHGVRASAAVNEAVTATRGQVILTPEGQLLRAYFSSQCGGRPGSAKDVWPTRVGWEFNKATPVQGKPRPFACQRAPLYRWEIARSDSDVNRRLRAWGRATSNEVTQITKLRSVEVVDRNDAERPNRYKLTDSNGREFELRAEELRTALNHPTPETDPITRENRVNSGDLEVEVWANQVRIRGRGWGHGVGMCQWCARGFAENGQDWNTMLQTFYPSAIIRKMY